MQSSKAHSTCLCRIIIQRFISSFYDACIVDDALDCLHFAKVHSDLCTVRISFCFGCQLANAFDSLQRHMLVPRNFHFESTELIWCRTTNCVFGVAAHAPRNQWRSRFDCQRILKLIWVRACEQTNSPTRETEFFCCRLHCSIEIRWCLWGAECYGLVLLIADVAVIKCWHNYTYNLANFVPSRTILFGEVPRWTDEWKFGFKAKRETHTNKSQKHGMANTHTTQQYIGSENQKR